MMNFRNICLVITMGCLYGCVAVWGEAHKVTSADANGINIQFDSGLTSSARTANLAKQHCMQYGKIAEPINSKMPGLLIGIIEDSYACVSSTSANKASETETTSNNASSQRLRELQALRKDGVITEEEFQKKKQKILEEL